MGYQRDAQDDGQQRVGKPRLRYGAARLLQRVTTRTLGLMISDRRRAVAVAKAAEEFIKQLSLALKAVQANGSAEEVERIRKSIGEVVGVLETELLWPL